jgi:hypothetical protein
LRHRGPRISPPHDAAPISQSVKVQTFKGAKTMDVGKPMDLDPSLSLTADGLWSDDESVSDNASVTQEPDFEAGESAPKRRVYPLST